MLIRFWFGKNWYLWYLFDYFFDHNEQQADYTIDEALKFLERRLKDADKASLEGSVPPET